MRAIRPLILVQTNPQETEQDSSIIISARLYNRDTLLKLPVKKIYMNIVSTKDGHEVWPNEVIRKDTWKMDIQISTRDMKPGHTYVVRISNNRNQSPQGSTEFKVLKNAGINIIPIAFIKMPTPEDKVRPKTIHYKKFVTQMDARVCPFCQEDSLGHSPGLDVGQYYMDDKDAPEIPVHINCRCTFDIVYLEEFKANVEESFTRVAKVWHASQDMPTILKAIKIIKSL